MRSICPHRMRHWMTQCAPINTHSTAKLLEVCQCVGSRPGPNQSFTSQRRMHKRFPCCRAAEKITLAAAQEANMLHHVSNTLLIWILSFVSAGRKAQLSSTNKMGSDKRQLHRQDSKKCMLLVSAPRLCFPHAVRCAPLQVMQLIGKYIPRRTQNNEVLLVCHH